MDSISALESSKNVIFAMARSISNNPIAAAQSP
jgi:hypothetical protein